MFLSLIVSIGGSLDLSWDSTGGHPISATNEESELTIFAFNSLWVDCFEHVDTLVHEARSMKSLFLKYFNMFEMNPNSVCQQVLSSDFSAYFINELVAKRERLMIIIQDKMLSSHIWV